MSYDVEYKTVQICVKDTKIWVNAPQCILRIGGLDPKWINKLSIYNPKNDMLTELFPHLKLSHTVMTDMIDIVIPKPESIKCGSFDCIHNKFPVGICKSVPDLAIVKQGLFQCKNFKDCLG